MAKEITHRELESLIQSSTDIELIDVREQNEYDMIRIPSAKLIPKSEFPDKMHAIDFSKPVYVFCRTGGRSGMICAWLETQGKDATNVSGGIKALFRDHSAILEITDSFDPIYLW